MGEEAKKNLQPILNLYSLAKKRASGNFVSTLRTGSLFHFLLEELQPQFSHRAT